jgi:hypothetical protein
MESLPVTGEFVPSPSIVPIDRGRSSQLFDVTPVNEIDAVDILHCGEAGRGELDVAQVVKFLNESGFRESDKDPRLESLFNSLRERSTISLNELTALKGASFRVGDSRLQSIHIHRFPDF